MLAKEIMAAYCAHNEPAIAQNAHNAMVVQHDFDDGRISLEEAIAQMTAVQDQFIGSGEEEANNIFRDTIRRQIQELE